MELFPGQHWFRAHRGDRRAIALYLRHYSAKRYADGRPRREFCAPGEDMVLLTPHADALWVWHRSKPELRRDGQAGVCCSVFRNESPVLSSALVLEAEQLGWARWPGERFFTYVDGRKVRSPNPGYCFKRAGWVTAGRSKSGLLLLEKYPEPGAREDTA